MTTTPTAPDHQAGAASGPRQWIEDATARPWYEKPDALDRIPDIAARHNLGPQERQWLEQWVTDGYFVVDDLVPEILTKQLAERLDALWFQAEPLPGLRICDVMVDGELRMNCPHEELLALPEAVRRRADAESNWRIMGYHSFEQVAAQIFALDRTRTLCSAVFDMPAVPLYSLLFAKGSQQTVHQDTSAFHVWPKNYLIGVWIACEDIRPESGPLEYYPGSHREPLFDAFDNYPQTQRRTASREDVARYDAHVLEIAQRYPRKLFTPRRGAALFWHGMLLHGGSPVTDQAATRKSFVIHYMAEGTNREAEIVGPFNW